MFIVGAYGCFLTFGLAMMVTSVLWGNDPWQPDRVQAALNMMPVGLFVGFLDAACLLVIATLLWKVRWMARYGVEATAVVTRFDAGNKGDVTLAFAYEHDGRPYESMTWVKNADGEQLAARRATFPMLVNPNHPAECLLARSLGG